MCRQGYRNKQVYDPLWSVRNRRPPDVMPPAGRKGTFDGRYGCRKCFCVTSVSYTHLDVYKRQVKVDVL